MKCLSSPFSFSFAAPKIYKVKDFVDVFEATTPDPQTTEPSKPKKPKRYTNKYNVDDDFLYDLYNMDNTTFLGKYFDYFGAPMMHTPLEYKNGYALTDENFRELKPRYFDRQIVKWKDGERRRLKMFIFSKLRIQMKPNITLEELIYCLAYDRLNFFENKDKALTNETLIRIAYNALHADYDIKPSAMKVPKYKIDKTFCIEHGTTPNAYKNKVNQILHYERIDGWYDPAKSVMDNLKFAEENDLKTSRRTLYRYCKSRGLDLHGTKPQTPPEQLTEPSKQTASMELKEASESAREPQNNAS